MPFTFKMASCGSRSEGLNVSIEKRSPVLNVPSSSKLMVNAIGDGERTIARNVETNPSIIIIREATIGGHPILCGTISRAISHNFNNEGRVRISGVIATRRDSAIVICGVVGTSQPLLRFVIGKVETGIVLCNM